MRVLVCNLPLVSYATATVFVPDDTKPEDMQAALAAAVIAGDYEDVEEGPEAAEVDEDFIRNTPGWSFLLDD